MRMNYQNIDDHVEAVMRWLDDHVLVFDTPHELTIFDVQADSETYKGSFRLKLDEVILDSTKLEDPFTFSLGQNGKPSWYIPMFYSPLGAPASYGAIKLSDETERAIQQQLDRLLPRMRPLGLDHERGILLTYDASLEDRMLDANDYQRCFSELPGSSHTVQVKLPSHD